MECLFKAAWIVIVIYGLQGGFLCWDASHEKKPACWDSIFLQSPSCVKDEFQLSFLIRDSYIWLWIRTSGLRRLYLLSRFCGNKFAPYSGVAALGKWIRDLATRALKIMKLGGKKKTWLDLRTEEINNKRYGARLLHSFFFFDSGQLDVCFFSPRCSSRFSGTFFLLFSSSQLKM